MSNVVQFLETIACLPMPVSANDFAIAVSHSGLPAEMQQALLARDIEALRVSLGGRAQMLCMVVPAENDEPADDDHDDGEDNDSPDAELGVRGA